MTAIDTDLKAFQDICIASAPSFSGAEKIAREKYGFFLMPDLSGNWEGASFDHGLQLKFVKSESCVVLGPTTAPGRNEEFSEMIRKTPGLGINPDGALIAAPIAGVEFVFRHVVNNKRDQYGMLASKALGRMLVEEVQKMRIRSAR